VFQHELSVLRALPEKLLEALGDIGSVTDVVDGQFQ
jgi:hypothetical protein